MERLRYKTLDELGLELMTWQSDKDKLPLHVFSKGAWVGLETHKPLPRGGHKPNTMMSGQFQKWVLPGVPAYPVTAMMQCVLETLNGRGDIQRVVLHQLKAKLDRLCEQFPLPDGIGPVTELVEVEQFAAQPATGDNL